MNRFAELLTIFESDASNRSLEISGKRRDLVIEALRIAATYIPLPPIPHASNIERQIVGRLVEDLLAAGCSLSVNDGEEVTVKKSTDKPAIYAALSSTDSDYLFVHRPGDKRDPWIRLVWGNDAAVISDYLTSLDDLIAGAQALADQLDS